MGFNLGVYEGKYNNILPFFDAFYIWLERCTDVLSNIITNFYY
jgi:hypothetical protein